MASKSAPAATTTAVEAALPTATLDKYKTAGTIVEKALKHIIPLCVDGASILEICNAGDKVIEDESDKVYNAKPKGSSTADSKPVKIGKGSAHPTCLNVNGLVGNFAPLPSDPKFGANLKLKTGDLVSIQLGAHIDGYAVIGGESLVVLSTESSVNEIKADLIQAAYQAAEIALRSAKPGLKNWEITTGIAKILDEYKESSSSSGGGKKIKGVEGAAAANSTSFGWRMTKDDIQSKKTVTPFPSQEQRRDSDNTHTLEEGEVYSLTVAVTNAEEAKAKDSTSYPTSIYCRLPTTYQLKMKSSRETYSEIVKKAGAFPFPLRVLENEGRAKLAVRECVQHGLLKPFDVQVISNNAESGDLVASFTITFAITKTGTTRLTPIPVWYSADKVKSSVEIKNEETKTLLTKSLKPQKKKNTDKKKEGGAAAASEEKKE